MNDEQLQELAKSIENNYWNILKIKKTIKKLIEALMITEYAISRNYGRELLDDMMELP